MQKHQSETVHDNHKQILLTVIESYYNYYCNNQTKKESNDCDFLFDVIYKLADDYLKLPEGKLVHSKGKKKILKWMNILNSRQIISSQITSTDESITHQYTIIDINTKIKSITLSDLIDSDHLIEDVRVNKELFAKIKEKYCYSFVYITTL